MIDEKLLKNEEKAIFALRSLYKQYGYLPFKMSKFEEYDLYLQNKDFLVSDRVITFNDTNGTLLALKPDVTLSIIKNTTDEVGCKQKVYYNENVYRVSGSTHQFKELMQTGLECIGDIDIFDVIEVINLGLKSLALISDSFTLDLSHMGVVSAILDEASDSDVFKKEIIKLISGKNTHEAVAMCQKYGINDTCTEKISSLISIYGKCDIALEKLKPLCTTDDEKSAYDELSALCNSIKGTYAEDKINLDFSVVNDMSYYNGIVFKGFLQGIPESVLSGGEYGKLLERMGRRSKAIGFAIYLDLLEVLDGERSGYDVDVLLIYNEENGKNAIALKNKLISDGKSVSMQRAVPSKLRYKEIIDITKEGK